jgi:glutaredoxin
MKRIIIMGLVAVLITSGCSLTQNKAKPLSLEEVKVKAADFINNNLMQAGQEVSIKEITEENGLYKIIVNMPNGQEITSYMTKDGKKFFPQVMDIAEIEQKTKEKKEKQAQAEEDSRSNLPKTEQPKVELFVMSYCPYGTQIEKGILPVLEKLGNKIDFQLKFCDYAMHGKKELDENLRQYCIQKEEPQKLFSYLRCFLDKGESDECLKTVDIDQAKLNNCVKAADKEYKVTEMYNDKSTWSNGRFPRFNVFAADNNKYNVKGSPTLVINGKQISSRRDPNSLLETICASFKNQPEECQATLSNQAPSPGFGFKAGGSNSGGGCSE